MEERLIVLESKLSFAEDLLDEVNRTVFRQQKQIEQLQQQVRLLYQQMQVSASAEKSEVQEEVPPHY